MRILGQTVLQPRTWTHTTQKAIFSFRGLASTALQVGSAPATATNRMYSFYFLFMDSRTPQVLRQRSHAFGKPLTSRSEETVWLSHLTLALSKRLRENLYSCPVRSASPQPSLWQSGKINGMCSNLTRYQWYIIYIESLLHRFSLSQLNTRTDLSSGTSDRRDE
jgi:hypothetical protein